MGSNKLLYRVIRHRPRGDNANQLPHGKLVSHVPQNTHQRPGGASLKAIDDFICLDVDDFLTRRNGVAHSFVPGNNRAVCHLDPPFWDRDGVEPLTHYSVLLPASQRAARRRPSAHYPAYGFQTDNPN